MFVKRRENSGNETGSCSKQRTLILCEYVPILSMPDTKEKDILCHNLGTKAQIFTKLYRLDPEA